MHANPGGVCVAIAHWVCAPYEKPIVPMEPLLHGCLTNQAIVS
jgi:hypothetical protein